ncbi:MULTISPECIES: hypothetical protein [unclassified Streptomyces]|uniref:hypothetical protein n=1 Tax=unclassified Streptomyces TaxID=2593676 RepID=UPI00210B0FA1|nr:hypothetical protein [Streptomyces sp. DpondAA-F4]
MDFASGCPVVSAVFSGVLAGAFVTPSGEGFGFAAVAGAAAGPGAVRGWALAGRAAVMVAVAVATARTDSGSRCLWRRIAGMRGFTKVSPMREMAKEQDLLGRHPCTDAAPPCPWREVVCEQPGEGAVSSAWRYGC